MKRKIALFLVLAMLAAAGASLAQTADGRWWTNPDVARRLSLTDAEKARLEDLHAASLRKRIDLKSAVAKERLNLDDALNNPKSTDAALRERYQSLTRAQNALSAERFNFILQVRRLLGQERFTTFKATFDERRRSWMQERRERRGAQGGAMGGGPGGGSGSPMWGE